MENLELETVKELEKRFFQEGMYYSIDPSRKSYKDAYPLYKCIYTSQYGALLQSFREDGVQAGELYVPHGAKRYVPSSMNEHTVRKAHYQSFIDDMKEKSIEHQNLANKLKKEVELAELQLSTWK